MIVGPLLAPRLRQAAADATDAADASWLSSAADALAKVGIIVGGSLVVWLIARLLIRAVTRSIATGAPMSRHARRAIRRAKVEAGADPAELRLLEDRRAQRAGTIRAVLNSGLTVTVVATAVMMILDAFGLPVAPLIASAGIVGVALGFGAQSLVKDVLSGLFMLIEDQYGVGDIVDLGPATGTVEEVGLRSTRLRALDGTVWYVPNGEVTRVGNMTRLWSRALIELRLDYETDMDAAREALLEALEAAKSADPNVAAAVLGEGDVPGIEAFDYDSVVMRLMVQVRPTTQWTVMRAVRRELRPALARRAVRLAVPDHTLYLDAQHPAARSAAGGEDTAPSARKSLDVPAGSQRPAAQRQATRKATDKPT